MNTTSGLVLFAHGSRDARWAEPFHFIAAAVSQRRPDLKVALAFLETMRPTLDEAVASLVSQGCAAIRIAPIFFGQGGHVRDDLPRLVKSLQVHFPSVALTCLAPAGDNRAVRDAVAAFCLEGM